MAQARELLAALVPPYDLMARWQLYTGLRVSELLRLTIEDILKPNGAKRAAPEPAHQVIDVLRKGRKSGYVIASRSLLEETAGYVSAQRRAWLTRAARRQDAVETPALFIGSRGTPVSKNRYQQVIHCAGRACGFKATTHLLRAYSGAQALLTRREQELSELRRRLDSKPVRITG